MDFFIIPNISVLEWILLKKQKFDYNFRNSNHSINKGGSKSFKNCNISLHSKYSVCNYYLLISIWVLLARFRSILQHCHSWEDTLSTIAMRLWWCDARPWKTQTEMVRKVFGQLLRCSKARCATSDGRTTMDSFATS